MDLQDQFNTYTELGLPIEEIAKNLLGTQDSYTVGPLLEQRGYIVFTQGPLCMYVGEKPGPVEISVWDRFKITNGCRTNVPGLTLVSRQEKN